MVEFNKIKGITTISIADIGGTIISGGFWFFLATLIEPEEFGELSYYIGIVSLVGAFCVISSQETVMVYASKKFKILPTLYFFSLIGSVIGSLVLMIIFYKIDLIILLFGYVVNTLAIGELLGRKEFGNYAKHFLVQKILTLVLGLTFYFLFDVEGIIYALGIAYIGFIIIFFKRFKISKLEFKMKKEKFKFILYNYLYEVVGKSNNHLNKLIIVPILGFSVLGNFTLALQIYNIAMIIPVIVVKYTIPYDAIGNKQIKLKKITIFVAVGIAISSFFILPIIIPDIFPKYNEVVEAMSFVTLSIIPMTIARVYSSELLGNEKSFRLIFSRVVSMIVFIVFIIIFGKDLGLMGISLGYLISTICEMACIIFKFNRIEKI